MTQPLLPFDHAPAYPWQAGHRGIDTSAEAAESVDACGLRAQVLDMLRRCGPQTADEAAGWLNVSVLSIRPRFTELLRLGAIHRTGDRRANESGRMAHVFSVNQ
jgi:predicted ArsR family transcriptional regulator